MDSREILRELGRDEGFPRAALEAAAERRAEMVPLLLEAIESWLVDPDGGQVEPMLLFFAFHLLGNWKEKSAYRPLARLLARPDEEIDTVFGDTLGSTADRVMAAVCDDDPRPLFDIILDAGADEYARSEMCEALATAVFHGDLDRAAVARFLHDCFTDLRPRTDCFVWHGWQSAIARLGLRDLEPLVKEAFERGYISPSWLGFEDFKEDLQRGIDEPGEPRWPGNREHTLFGDTIEELSTWYCFSDAYKVDRERDRLLAEEEKLDWLLRSEPYTNPFKDVGRNDPCPCGSGKKFKKCCLA
jgi:hypothetical protein